MDPADLQIIPAFNVPSEAQNFLCLDMDLSVLVVPQEGLRLMGAFAFQVLFGQVEANGYLCKGKKFSAKYFIHTSHPITHSPLYFKLKPEPLLENVKDIVASRLREIVSQPMEIAKLVEQRQPCAVVLIKLQPNFPSQFIKQYNEGIFRPTTRCQDNTVTIGPTCYILPRLPNFFMEPGYPTLSNSLYDSSEQNIINEILGRISLNGGPVLILGNKGVGKSTLMRYLINETLSRLNARKIFLLDTDVGQSEAGPPGCISLVHIEKPLIGAPFASEKPSYKDSYFFGSNSFCQNTIHLYVKKIHSCL